MSTATHAALLRELSRIAALTDEDALTRDDLDTLAESCDAGMYVALPGRPGRYTVFPSAAAASAAARQEIYALHPSDLRELVGGDALRAWKRGQWADVERTAARSLRGWVESRIEVPAEHFAEYDGRDVYLPCEYVAYRVE